jgi:PhzF family phenazine biosynthesis protein
MQVHIVDAFCDGPYSGNPAAVCLVRGTISDKRMQQIAGEMNLSETAFLAKRADGWDLRWFTPKVEVDLCGHATLASAHFLYSGGLADPARPIDFHTRSGLLRALPAGGAIELCFPSIASEPVDAPPGLAEALGCAPVATHRAADDLLVELADEAAVRSLHPDLVALGALPHRCVAVTARGEEHDFVSRVFGPRVGIPEDPATGSTHCALGPLWAARLGKGELVAHQASARGGELHVFVEPDGCHLVGRCVTVLRGELAAEAL